MKVISGAQTGADLAGLWAAKSCNIPTGGWAPKGFETLNGPKPEMAKTFGILEHSRGYRGRTIENLSSADFTVVLVEVMSAGSRLTIDQCKKLNKNHKVIRLDSSDLTGSLNQAKSVIDQIKGLVEKKKLLGEDFILNVAGNSANNSARMFEFTFKFCLELFSTLGYQSSLSPKDYAKYQDSWS